MSFNLTCFLYVFSVASVTGQQLLYRIDYNDDSIGYMLAKRISEEGKVTYELETESTVSLILSFKHYAIYKSEYKNGMLVQAMAEYTVNDKKRSSTKIYYEKDRYMIEKDGDVTEYAVPIHESIATLYFKEPSSQSIFSERQGDFLPLQRINDNEYKITKPDDRTNVYYFKGGQCEKVKVNTAVATIYLTRIR